MNAPPKSAFFMSFGWALGAFITLCSVNAHSASKSSSSSGNRNSIELNLGYSSQPFSGLRGANFEKIDTPYYGLALSRKWGRWQHGFFYSALASVAIKTFTLSDNSIGNYQLSFQRYGIFSGIDFGPCRSHLVIGSESITWAGSPNLGMKDASFIYYGLDFAYDFDISPTLKAPLQLAVLMHPERKFEFANYPSDTVTASASTEITLGTGLLFEF